MLWSVGELPLTGGTDLTWFDRASHLAHISSIWTLHYLLGKIHRTRGLEYQRADTFLYTSRGPCRSTETTSSAYISATSVLMCSPNNSSYADIRTKGNRISFVRPYYKRDMTIVTSPIGLWIPMLMSLVCFGLSTTCGQEKNCFAASEVRSFISFFEIRLYAMLLFASFW